MLLFGLQLNGLPVGGEIGRVPKHRWEKKILKKALQERNNECSYRYSFM